MEGPEVKRTLSLAALGRPFRLGMLYDSTEERLIPGFTLWDEATLANKTVQQQESSDCHVLCSDSLDNKASALEVDASLKLSLLGGLVNVDGAAKYLECRKSSSRQERVTLQYKCTTRAESLTMEQLGKGRIQHPEVFEQGTATHVVTSILYGAQAFFVFDREQSSSKDEKKANGNLHATIKKLPCIEIDGDGKLKLSEEEMKSTEKFTCRFFGDFLLRQNPASFSDAVKFYKELPKLIVEGGNGVPVRVDLYPLCEIDDRASKLVREISMNLISDTETIFEKLHEIKTECKDILESDSVKRFRGIAHQIEEFKQMTETYERATQKALSEILPRIRGGGDEEGRLVDLLNGISQSPFSILALSSWLETIKKHARVLDEYTRALADIRFATEAGELEAVIQNPDKTYSLCLIIAVPSRDSHLEAMRRYLGRRHNSISHHEGAGHLATLQQVNNSSMMEVGSLYKAANVYRAFHATNEAKRDLSFIVSQTFSESDEYYSRIKCYKCGKLMSDDYELPSAPERVEVMAKDTAHDSVTVSWSPPKYGASTIEGYIVSCCETETQSVVSTLTVGPGERQASLPGLAANTAYEVSVRGKCEVGEGPVGDAKVAVRTKPASHPEDLHVRKISPTKVFLTWRAPSCVADGCKIEKYIIKQEASANHWKETARISSKEPSYKVAISPDSVPNFKVAAFCGPDGVSRDSEVSVADPVLRSTQLILANSRLIQEHPCIYQPELKEVSINNHDMIEKKEFGERHFGVPEKVIMLVGATGSGKTTLINGIVNYIFGVEWEDPFRFKMILEPNAVNQAKSQTTKITSYTLHHQAGFRVPYTLTVIDTPGFGDSSGIMRDKAITEIIRKFFTTYNANGITHIDAVGFVAISALPRLTPTQKYIFDQTLSLFGKDIADNIFLLLTYADGKKPQVLSGIAAAEIPYKKFFKFNNSVLYERQSTTDDNDGEGEDDSFDKMFWDMGFKSYKLFLNQLNAVQSKSLVLTQDVLTERNNLETYVAGIQVDIQKGISTLNRLQKEGEILRQHQAEIDRNKDFEYTVDEEVFEKVKTEPGVHVTNCLKCNRTCHDNCAYANNGDKKHCCAMSNGYCTVCPFKCVWSVHENFPFIYKLTIRQVTKTVEELRRGYEEANNKKFSTENLIEEVNKEFEAQQVKVLGLTDLVRKSLKRLEEIALKPNPLTTSQYIDILIESEKSEARPGWEERVKQYTEVRKEAQYMEEVAQEGYDPFQHYLSKIAAKLDPLNQAMNKVLGFFGLKTGKRAGCKT